MESGGLTEQAFFPPKAPVNGREFHAMQQAMLLICPGTMSTRGDRYASSIDFKSIFQDPVFSLFLNWIPLDFSAGSCFVSFLYIASKGDNLLTKLAIFLDKIK